MRACWNWQTGTLEGRMSYGVWVQVPLLAPNQYNPNLFPIGGGFGFIIYQYGLKHIYLLIKLNII